MISNTRMAALGPAERVDAALSSRDLSEVKGVASAQAAAAMPLPNGNIGLKLVGSLGKRRQDGRTACNLI